ncbi:hypothetical protein CHUAL_013865 [Chamberlinius hualienensis]
MAKHELIPLQRTCNLMINPIQRMVLYETKARFYLIGSNNTQTRFWVLKIHRTEPKELHIVDDKVEYTNAEIKSLLAMIEHGNKTKTSHKGSSSLIRSVSAFGILGFVRFLEGYYIILITKRRRVGLIGHHTIYKIEETCMHYIPNDSVRSQHPDESRYVKIFQNMDLSSNFYFSYSYDLTHSLQYNLTGPKNLPTDLTPGEMYAFRTKPVEKFTWNWYLLGPVTETVHHGWILHVIHGFVEQSNISIFGKAVYVALIARRSNKYAGTRFLKRGATGDGYVANEVETEQILYSASKSSLHTGHFSSFVQVRGSIPFYWSQDTSKMVPKPPIIVDRADPCAKAAGQHFNQLFSRYGSPIIVLDLIKKREKKKHESALGAEFVQTVEYLNQFLPPQHRIIHIRFDMARANKHKEVNVFTRLSEIAYDAVKKIGIFHTRGLLYTHVLKSDPRWLSLGGLRFGRWIVQTGVVRVNCVDCLDRTNTAQFAIGKVALAFQLYALGVLESPQLDFDSDCVRMLEELYEDHGDTLALQYGGSQLVHRIKTYRKTAPWTSQSRDIVHTLSRYYSNTFSDADKQNAINLFLGVYRPYDHHRRPIWELTSDYDLHHSSRQSVRYVERGLTRWWKDHILDSLPLPYEQTSKTVDVDVIVVKTLATDECLDSYSDYYRPYELTVFSELFAFTMNHSVRDYMPNFTTDFSPFSVRVRPGKRREELGGGATTTNPSVTGQSSSTSSTSSNTDSSTSSDESSDLEYINVANSLNAVEPKEPVASPPPDSPLTFEKALPNIKDVYGIEFREPSRLTLIKYKRFVHLGSGLQPPEPNDNRVRDLNGPILIQSTAIAKNSSLSVKPPTVNKESKEMYRTYIERGTSGGCLPNHRDLHLYHNYVKLK